MKPYWTNGRATLWQGHVLDALAAMEAQSVHMCATSPPYWGLRDYQIEGVEWPPVSYSPMAGLAPIEIAGCEEGCEHVWGEERSTNITNATTVNLNRNRTGHDAGDWGKERGGPVSQGQYCQLCSGWRGSLGLEPTVTAYVGHMVLVARALWRVLRDDGTFWLNLGSSYSGSWGNYAPGGIKNEQRPRTESGQRYERPAYSSTTFKPPTANAGAFKPKDLIMIPSIVALALQADGWYLRSAIIWAKGISFCPTYSGSCMPESVRDRPTNSYEHVFLLSKNKRYFYDGDAVRENHSPATTDTVQRKRMIEAEQFSTEQDFYGARTGKRGDVGERMLKLNPAGRNLRSVWTINPGNFPGSHFATFPPALVEPMVRAGTSAKGVCPECLAPWVRVVEKEPMDYGMGEAETDTHKSVQANKNATKRFRSPTGHTLTKTTTETTGWAPTCSCGTEHPIPQEELDADPTLLDDFEIEPFEPVPATVLDPFAGTFTTGDVAIRLGRCAVGIELSKTYCDEHIIPRLSAGLQMELL